MDCLIHFLNSISEALDTRRTIDIVFTDFKSAFETMPHDLLISVLPRKGVGSRLCRWISEFLSDRSFRVKVHDTFSRTGYACTGCRQGTVLGSLLFIMFIDEVKHTLEERVEFYIYADDVKNS